MDNKTYKEPKVSKVTPIKDFEGQDFTDRYLRTVIDSYQLYFGTLWSRSYGGSFLDTKVSMA